MPPQYLAFWAAIATLADQFRDEDPALTGNLKRLAEHFHALPQDQQMQLRLDVQLLLVHFSKLALALTAQQAQDLQE